MAAIKVYVYAKCGTCRKAIKWLHGHGIAFDEKAIRETPPPPAELAMALKTDGNIRKILNTSSQDYRDLGLEEKLDGMSDDQVFALLQKNGNLVKRPFVVAGNTAWAGFKEDIWRERLS
jgi:arsenate reductase